MEDTNTTQVTLFTPEQQEIINAVVNTAIDGFRAKQNKEFQKLNDTVSKLATPKTEVAATTTDTTDTAVMKRQLAEVTAKMEAAEQKAIKAERSNVLNKALGSYTFVNDKARDVVFRTLESDLAVTSDGMYVIGDQPIEQAVKSHLDQLSGLIAPKPVNGTGATSGNTQPAPVAQSAYKPGMTMEEWQAANKALFNF